MKAAIVLVVMFSTAILLAGCGHYGMGRVHNDDWHSQTTSDFRNMNGNAMQVPKSQNMRGGGTQGQGAYGI